MHTMKPETSKGEGGDYITTDKTSKKGDPKKVGGKGLPFFERFLRAIHEQMTNIPQGTLNNSRPSST